MSNNYKTDTILILLIVFKDLHWNFKTQVNELNYHNRIHYTLRCWKIEEGIIVGVVGWGGEHEDRKSKFILNTTISFFLEGNTTISSEY